MGGKSAIQLFYSKILFSETSVSICSVCVSVRVCVCENSQVFSMPYSEGAAAAAAESSNSDSEDEAFVSSQNAIQARSIQSAQQGLPMTSMSSRRVAKADSAAPAKVHTTSKVGVCA